MKDTTSVKKLTKKLYAAIVMLCILAITITASTFAWFSGNKTVSTTRVTSRTGTDSIELQISRTDNAFTPEENCQIMQVNDTDVMKLQPVSTADLSGFVYDRGNVEGNATGFEKVENEERYYHGRVYLKAVGDTEAGNKMAIYLDAGDGVLVSAKNDTFLNAVRLGLVFNEDRSTAVIFKNKLQSKISNTIFEGTQLPAGMVLGVSGDKISSYADPAVTFDKYTITIADGESRLPENKLFVMEFNKIYPVDIYFYLEGCDGDCTDSISFEDVDIHLAFYGVLVD